MNWLETITIRCAGSREKRDVMDLLQRIGMPEGGKPGQSPVDQRFGAVAGTPALKVAGS